MTDPGTAPDNELDYQSHAHEVIDERDMEALAANAEQEIDMGQVIRHNQYIGWVLGVSKTTSVSLVHKGGNQVGIDEEILEDVTLLIPYPPKSWKP